MHLVKWTKKIQMKKITKINYPFENILPFLFIPIISLFSQLLRAVISFIPLMKLNDIHILRMLSNYHSIWNIWNCFRIITDFDVHDVYEVWYKPFTINNDTDDVKYENICLSFFSSQYHRRREYQKYHYLF